MENLTKGYNFLMFEVITWLINTVLSIASIAVTIHSNWLNQKLLNNQKSNRTDQS